MSDIANTIAREIRTLGILEGPSDRQPPPRDLDAERRLLATMREDPSVTVDPRWLGHGLHESLAVAILACRELDYEPTIERLVVAVEGMGADPVRLRAAIEEIVDVTPCSCRAQTNEDIDTVRELARRRRILRALEVADVLLRCPSAAVATVDHALGAVVREANREG